MEAMVTSKQAWLAKSGHGQDSVKTSQVLPHQTQSSKSLWTLICGVQLVCSHIETPNPNFTLSIQQSISLQS